MGALPYKMQLGGGVRVEACILRGLALGSGTPFSRAALLPSEPEDSNTTVTHPLNKTAGTFRKCCAPPYQMIRQHSLLFIEEALRNELTYPRPSRKAPLGFEYFDPQSSSYHITNLKFSVYWVQFRKDERQREGPELKTGGSGVLGLEWACSPVLGQGRSHCWRKQAL